MTDNRTLPNPGKHPEQRFVPIFGEIRTVGINSYRVRLFILVAGCLLLFASQALSQVDVPLDSVGQIRIDDEGRLLNYPVSVAYDPVLDEIYLVNGGDGRIIVYGPDFFPRMSIGSGRGVLAPRGLTVLANGEVYICQIRNYKNPSARITILNGAFFVEREIILDQNPEAAGFVPRHLAISKEGLIYLAGDNERGVMVLDEEGNFLRWLRPIGNIITYFKADLEKLEQEKKKSGSEGQISPEETDKTDSGEDLYADIPEEFRPRTREERQSSGPVESEGPVKINFVHIDDRGRIYLISDETNEIYVYGPDEKLLFSFGEGGGSPGQLSQPRSLAVDMNRELIYVVDYMRHTILAYSLEGEYIFEVGGRGNSPGWFNFPSGIVLNKKRELVVADLFNRRVQVLRVGYEEVLPYLDTWSGEKQKDLPGDSQGGGFEVEILEDAETDSIPEEPVGPAESPEGAIPEATSFDEGQIEVQFDAGEASPRTDREVSEGNGGTEAGGAAKDIIEEVIIDGAEPISPSEAGQ